MIDTYRGVFFETPCIDIDRCITFRNILDKTSSNLGKYLDKVDRVMTQVDWITEDIDHMPVAVFIFRKKESDEVHHSSNIRCFVY